MSVLMAASERAGAMTRQPPRLIVGRFAPTLRDPEADLVALLAHGAFGAAAGAAFALLPVPRTAVTPAALGFGLAVWASAYEGWVPAVGILPPAHRDQRGRAITMVAAHLVYGMVLGRLVRR